MHQAQPILAARDQHERVRAAALASPRSPLHCFCLAAWQPFSSTRAATLLNALESNDAAHMRAATQVIRPNSLPERVLLTHVRYRRRGGGGSEPPEIHCDAARRSIFAVVPPLLRDKQGVAIRQRGVAATRLAEAREARFVWCAYVHGRGVALEA